MNRATYCLIEAGLNMLDGHKAECAIDHVAYDHKGEAFEWRIETHAWVFCVLADDFEPSATLHAKVYSHAGIGYATDETAGKEPDLLEVGTITSSEGQAGPEFDVFLASMAGLSLYSLDCWVRSAIQCASAIEKIAINAARMADEFEKEENGE